MKRLSAQVGHASLFVLFLLFFSHSLRISEIGRKRERERSWEETYGGENKARWNWVPLSVRMPCSGYMHTSTVPSFSLHLQHEFGISKKNRNSRAQAQKVISIFFAKIARRSHSQMELMGLESGLRALEQCEKKKLNFWCRSGIETFTKQDEISI